jgi:hypothetical protein
MMQNILDALYMQNIKSEKSILEKNDTIQYKYRHYLKIIVVKCLLEDDQKESAFSINLRLLISRSLLYLSSFQMKSNEDQKWALEQSLNQLDKIIK